MTIIFKPPLPSLPLLKIIHLAITENMEIQARRWEKEKL